MGTFLTRKMSQTRQRKKKPVSAELQEQRDNRRKERNRAAARKCREKRDNQIRYLEDQKEKLMMTNQGIKNENEKMMQAIPLTITNLNLKDSMIFWLIPIIFWSRVNWGQFLQCASKILYYCN